jgi:hypothetical protein
MRRWSYEGDDDNVDGFFGDAEDEELEADRYITEEDYEELVAKASHLQECQLELIEQDLQQRLLADAVGFCKKSWSWPFSSRKSRLVAVAKTFRFFQRLTDPKDRR